MGLQDKLYQKGMGMQKTPTACLHQLSAQNTTKEGLSRNGKDTCMVTLRPAGRVIGISQQTLKLVRSRGLKPVTVRTTLPRGEIKYPESQLTPYRRATEAWPSIEWRDFLHS